MPMVQYWKDKVSVQAKVTINEDGALTMKLDGEEYAFPGFPRGYLLFGKLSKLKHEIKNQIFNDSWHMLEQGIPESEIVSIAKEKLVKNILKLAEETKYDRVAPGRYVKSVKEIYRAWGKITDNPKALELRDILCFILQEDDSYRFRVQWLVTYFNPNKLWMRILGKDPIEQFKKALEILEHGEVLDDMKERIRLLRRILLMGLRDKQIKDLFIKFCAEVDWEKVKLTEADKFHFRGKYFKVDYNLFDY